MYVYIYICVWPNSFYVLGGVGNTQISQINYKKKTKKIFIVSVKDKMAFTKIVPRRNQDLQKSYYCEVETYKNKVWAKLGLTKTRFG